MSKKFKKGLLAIAALTAMGSAYADGTAIDVTTVTAGITSASVALIAVLGALMSLSVSIFGIVKVYRFVSKKAGA